MITVHQVRRRLGVSRLRLAMACRKAGLKGKHKRSMPPVHVEQFKLRVLGDIVGEGKFADTVFQMINETELQ